MFAGGGLGAGLALGIGIAIWLEVRDRSIRTEKDAAAAMDTLAETEYRDYLVGRALRLMQAEFEEQTWKVFWQNVALGRPSAEVAGAFGISVASVYAAKSRILRRLRQELDGLLD